MGEYLADPTIVILILSGAFIAGFTTGFAGFGTGLVAAGFWFHALPASFVPPLVVLTSVVAQIIGLHTVRNAFDWRRVAPFILAGIIAVPIGVLALKVLAPGFLRLSVGIMLIGYALFQLGGLGTARLGAWGGRSADMAVGFGGGFLGGFAGLSGPLPLIWLQLRGGSSAMQRSVYQPFNLTILALAALGMLASGQMGREILIIAGICLPVTVIGAWLGAYMYMGINEATFGKAVLLLLLASGAILTSQTLALLL